jgi:hypothetical protein
MEVDIAFVFCSILNDLPYAERPEGSRISGLPSAQTFGTVHNIN